MFWGLSLDPAKRYAKVVDNAFHISAAVLDTSSVTDDEIIRVMVEVEGYETLICNLSKKLGILQFPLDLQFMEGSRIAFYTQGGKGVVHLSGYVIPDVDDLDEDLDMEEEEGSSDEETPQLVPIQKKRKGEITEANVKKAKLALDIKKDEDDDDDDDDDSDDGEEEEEGGDEEMESDDGEEEEEESDEDDDEEDDEDDDGDEEEMMQKMMDALKGTKSKDKGKTPDKKGMKTPEPQKGNKTPDKNVKQDKTPKKGEVTMNGTTQKDKKAQNTPAKIEGTPKATPGKTPPKPQMVTVGGVKIQDMVVGKGKKAKPGNKVAMFYTGRLQGGKVFDQCNSGKGFWFRLGGGEVIKAWDNGVAGMQVGGKRKLICPPKLAYGSQGAPPAIPPNATLIFDVELRDVK